MEWTACFYLYDCDWRAAQRWFRAGCVFGEAAETYVVVEVLFGPEPAHERWTEQMGPWRGKVRYSRAFPSSTESHREGL